MPFLGHVAKKRQDDKCKFYPATDLNTYELIVKLNGERFYVQKLQISNSKKTVQNTRLQSTRKFETCILNIQNLIPLFELFLSDVLFILRSS